MNVRRYFETWPIVSRGQRWETVFTWMKLRNISLDLKNFYFIPYFLLSTVTNGANALQWLHSNGYLKKVATADIVLTPTAAHSVPLADVNRIVELQAAGLNEQQIKNMMQDDTNQPPRGHSMINANDVSSNVAEPGIPAPEVLAQEAKDGLTSALAELDELMAELGGE